MGKLHKAMKKYSPMLNIERKTLGEDTFDKLHPMGTQAETAYDARKAAEKAAKDAEDPTKNPVIPMADEEEIARARRRREARRRGGRSSTILSSGDGLGG